MERKGIMLIKEDEARRTIDAASERGIYLRVIGGLAIKMHCPSANHPTLAREYADIDYVGYHDQGRDIRRLFEDLGYVPNRRFNALQGRKRLMYFHPEEECDIDVFLDIFDMCHKLDFSGRLHLDDYTIPLPEVLLTKLQVVKMNEKDLKDIFTILSDLELGPAGEPGVIDEDYILDLCCDDWGWYRTLTDSIAKCIDLAPDYLEEPRTSTVIGKLERLHRQMEERPKSFRWKTRARVGERVRWYRLPDEIDKPEDKTEG
jgi:hypothetical protein